MYHDKTCQGSNLDEVRTRFEQWRQARQGRARIPDELWETAMGVARRDGVGRTAATLHLDCSKLKRLMEQAGMIADRPAPPAFVKLAASDATSRPEYTLELEGRNGKLRIHCRGIAAADLVAVSRALWNVAS